MIGRAAAGLSAPPRRWILRLWGVPDINTRQKWSAVWPCLARLPTCGVRLLDAGCGAGVWSLELGARRPQWAIIGVDRELAVTEHAEAARCRLGLRNIAFICTDFLEFQPIEPFDVILAVHSAHYLVEDGRGAQLFKTFRAWLRPGGLLVVLVPRPYDEVPFVPLLPPPFQPRDVVAADTLRALCDAGGLEVDSLTPVVGPLGTWAKQLSALVGASRMLWAVTYPLQVTLVALDRLAPGDARPSASWLLLARRSRSESRAAVAAVREASA